MPRTIFDKLKVTSSKITAQFWDRMSSYKSDISKLEFEVARYKNKCLKIQEELDKGNVAWDDEGWEESNEDEKDADAAIREMEDMLGACQGEGDTSGPDSTKADPRTDTSWSAAKGRSGETPAPTTTTTTTGTDAPAEGAPASAGATTSTGTSTNTVNALAKALRPISTLRNRTDSARGLSISYFSNQKNNDHLGGNSIFKKLREEKGLLWIFEVVRKAEPLERILISL